LRLFVFFESCHNPHKWAPKFFVTSLTFDKRKAVHIKSCRQFVYEMTAFKKYEWIGGVQTHKVIPSQLDDER